MKETIGTASSTPMRLRPQPHWNTITKTPYAEPIDNKFSNAALIGTKIDLKTNISKIKLRAMTPVIKMGRRLCTRSETSAKEAVAPPTCALLSLLRVDANISPLLRYSNSPVRGSCGAVVGNTRIVAASPTWLRSGGCTKATPASFCRATAKDLSS